MEARLASIARNNEELMKNSNSATGDLPASFQRYIDKIQELETTQDKMKRDFSIMNRNLAR
jgi:hypothetical protein